MSEFIPSGGGGQTGFRAGIQKVGGNLAGMVIPNIGAFIAWGLLTALFIPTGWLPNEDFSSMVGPMILNLLPILIGYTGGRIVHGQRGAVIGSIATVGVIVGTDIPMFLGAMIIGPLMAWILKYIDKVLDPITPPGFEMLIGNFSLGIAGMLGAMLGYLGIGPIVSGITTFLGNGVGWLVDNSLLPLASLLIEPAKILFMNNAINFGVLTPLGVVDAEATGKSIMFMLETNPGPGLGLLVAFWLAGPKLLRGSAPGAIIIQFLGGIHEIYFPYVLLKPQVVLGVIAGGMVGVTTFMVTGVGLVSTPSPGSIFAYIAVTPAGNHLGVLLGIVLSAATSFVVTWFILKISKVDATEGDLAVAKDRSKEMKAGN